jgi:putative transposase
LKSREFHLISKAIKKSRFTEVQVVQALQKYESGVSTGVLCWEMGIAPATFYKWKSKYGGLEVSDVQKLKTLEEEHSRLKRMYADLAMDNQALRDLFSKKGWALPPSGK